MYLIFYAICEPGAFLPNVFPISSWSFVMFNYASVSSVLIDFPPYVPGCLNYKIIQWLYQGWGLYYLFFKDFIYLFVERREGREKERERNTDTWETHRLVAAHMPSTGAPGTQSRHVPWLGFESATFWFTVQCSISWAPPARVISFYF